MLLRILFLCALVSTPGAAAQSVRIGVLGLFHPREITLKAVSGQALVIHAERNNVVLEKSSGQDSAGITISGDAVIFKVGDQTVRTPTLDVSGRSGEAADFVLSIPGRISRRYRGILQVSAESGMLAPVVQMELETAVASVVQAESAPGTPLEALKAQAIASRSYFIAARGRHETFDFCDTTHCQFLREPPPPDSNAVRAALATRGLRLIYREHAVAAMFTRNCGGRTHTSQQVGLSTQNYPYFSVACDYCLRHPVRWVRRVSQAEASDLQQRGEASRLELDRRMGWDAVPSNSFTSHHDERSVILEGTGEGHGLGLCQAGAKAMAEAGASFQEVLAHYYPNTTLVNSPAK